MTIIGKIWLKWKNPGANGDYHSPELSHSGGKASGYIRVNEFSDNVEIWLELENLHL